jgi:hypothetical protein
LKPHAAAAGRPSVAPRQLERPSNVGLDPRRSSAFGKSGNAKADPRPLNDKNFFNSCIRTIITYASTHAYPYALSPKILTSPTGKDFTQLAFWLFQRFDPTLKAFGKVEDEVPLFFKRLNYPFQISKSALFAVGSPHSWPSVLAALSWLVELLNYDDRAEDAAAAQFDEKQRSERQFFSYASTAYRYFLAGDDAKAGAADDEMLGQFRERHAALLQSNKALQQVCTVANGWVGRGWGAEACGCDWSSAMCSACALIVNSQDRCAKAAAMTAPPVSAAIRMYGMKPVAWAIASSFRCTEGPQHTSCKAHSARISLALLLAACCSCSPIPHALKHYDIPDLFPSLLCPHICPTVSPLQSMGSLCAELDGLHKQPSPLAAAQAARQEVLADQRKFQEVIAGNQVGERDTWCEKGLSSGC